MAHAHTAVSVVEMVVFAAVTGVVLGMGERMIAFLTLKLKSVVGCGDLAARKSIGRGGSR